MALSADQLTDMQGDLGISDDETIFDDPALNRLYTRAESSYALAVYYGYRQLLAQANKFHDYTVANTSVKRSQMRAHLEKMADFWAEEARTTGNQVAIVGGLKIPTRRLDMPSDMTRRRSRYEINRSS